MPEPVMPPDARDASIVGASDQLARRAAKLVGDFGAAEHPRDLFDPLSLHQRAHAAAGRAAPFFFFDQEMSVGEGGDLRQMGHAQHLMKAREFLELASDDLGDRAADAR